MNKHIELLVDLIGEDKVEAVLENFIKSKLQIKVESNTKTPRRYRVPRTYKIWTATEDEFILNNHKHMPVKYIAKNLNRSTGSVWGRLDKLRNKLKLDIDN